MLDNVQEKLESGPMFDSAIVEHHFTPYLRDYDILVDVPAAAPGAQHSYIAVRYRYRFTHCTVAEVTTAVTDQAWRKSWEDTFTDFAAWERAGAPEGYVWGVCYSDAYPGLKYIANSAAAQQWTERLGQPMHEVTIETNGHNIRLIFHDVFISKIAQGNPDTNELTPFHRTENTPGRAV